MNCTPWRFLAVAISGWMNRHQQDVIAYLKEENRILRELGPKRIILNIGQKRRLARAAMGLGSDVILRVGSGIYCFSLLPDR